MAGRSWKKKFVVGQVTAALLYQTLGMVALQADRLHEDSDEVGKVPDTLKFGPYRRSLHRDQLEYGGTVRYVHLSMTNAEHPPSIGGISG